MRNVSYKICRENQNTYFVFIFFFRKSSRLWDNVEKYCGAGQATDDNMVHAHCLWITKATPTYSEYVTLIAFPLQQWLHARALILRYTYIDCLVQFTACNTNTDHPRALSPACYEHNSVQWWFRPSPTLSTPLARAEQFTAGGKSHIHIISRI